MLGVAGLVATTSTWMLLTGSDAPKGRRDASVSVASSASTAVEVSSAAPVRATVVATVPVKLGAVDRSAAGAVHAAVRMLKLDERLFPAVSPQVARALTVGISARSARDRLGDRAERLQREILAKGDLEGLRLRLAPIAARTVRYSVDRSEVEVFFLRLWSFPAKGALDDYATASVELVWEDGAWRLVDSSVIDGPYPVARFSARPVLASSAARFEDLLSGFSGDALIP